MGFDARGERVAGGGEGDLRADSFATPRGLARRVDHAAGRWRPGLRGSSPPGTAGASGTASALGALCCGTSGLLYNLWAVSPSVETQAHAHGRLPEVSRLLTLRRKREMEPLQSVTCPPQRHRCEWFIQRLHLSRWNILYEMIQRAK